MKVGGQTEIFRKYSIPNSTLSTITKTRDKIINYEANKFEPDIKLLRTASF